MDDDALPPKGGNGRRMRTIEFDEADAPLLMAAMRLAAATVFTYGPDHRQSMRRLQHYQELFQQFAPPEAEMFDNEMIWAEIAIAMDTSDSFQVTWQKGSWPDHARGRATVTIGERSWQTGYRVGVTQEQATELARALEEMAPMSCELRMDLSEKNFG